MFYKLKLDECVFVNDRCSASDKKLTEMLIINIRAEKKRRSTDWLLYRTFSVYEMNDRWAFSHSDFPFPIPSPQNGKKKLSRPIISTILKVYVHFLFYGTISGSSSVRFLLSSISIIITMHNKQQASNNNNNKSHSLWETKTHTQQYKFTNNRDDEWEKATAENFVVNGKEETTKISFWPFFSFTNFFFLL